MKSRPPAEREADRVVREAEKAKAARPIFGTQLMANPRIVSAVATDIFSSSLVERQDTPTSLRLSSLLLHSIPTTTITAVQTSTLIAPPSVMVVNVAKALKELGEEDAAQLTPGLWRQSARNLLNSFKLLCPPLDPANPSGPKYTHASEFEKHVLFFTNLDCFEESMSIWGPVEQKLRYELFRDGIFDHRLWEQRIGIAQSTHDYIRSLGMTPSSLPPATPTSSPSKRALHDDQNPSSTKQPRRTRGDEPRGGPPTNREGSVARDRTPCCLICAGPHMAQDHSSTKATFQDGSDHFSRLLVETRDIRTIKAFRGQGSNPALLLMTQTESMPAPSAAAITPPWQDIPCVEEYETGSSYPDFVPHPLSFLEHTSNPTPSTLPYPDLLPTVHLRPHPHGANDFSSLLDRVVQPYDVNAFQALLEKHDLSLSPPLRNLRYGFPLDRLPRLSSTVIIPNHPSALSERETVLEYLRTELEAGRMEGPFSRSEMEMVCRGAFYASPLIVASHDEGPDLPPKKRVCRNLSKGSKISGLGHGVCCCPKELQRNVQKGKEKEREKGGFQEFWMYFGHKFRDCASKFS
ncbi:hypothetical protein R3P38DRAFT_3246303 [Favolaschia claudopus]|uniref:GST N-terminal domain-containing protein n=1 Tax=Favolaschia claudopus TaxID=2862362 RepID=A0AAV9YZ54_9AGAR